MRRHHGGGFYAKSASCESIPPAFLRRKGWQLHSSCSICWGSTRLSDPTYYNTRAVVVGRWHRPFLFINEAAKLKRHMEKSLFYEVTLQQSWQEIYSHENESGGEENVVRVRATVKREEPLFYGVEVVKDWGCLGDGWASFKGSSNWNDGRGVKLGLSLAVVENMRGIEEERRWIDGDGGCRGGSRDEVDKRVEQGRRIDYGWRRFGCFVLVESFLVRRMNWILIMKYNFRHSHKVQGRWDWINMISLIF
ncbi:hypothetical protein Nepgr_022527 [Nepenthes gracilis]|uniref:Uncharacterized protein n=1 Tax=Nepenthes gracilis TaxID=150966 RepID=A0AAD3XYI2_NEPGR|nr:hypothetical protein Nepgr_022527 [Nepenthes gracilis]